MFTKIDKELKRKKRHVRIKKKVAGTAERPRLVVNRSHRNMFVQLVDDCEGKTLMSVSTLSKDFRSTGVYGGNVSAAKELGKKAAEIFKSKGISKISFDRSGYLYHGRLKALAEGIREAGINV